MRFDELKTPAYVIDEKMLIHNLEILHKVEEDTGCHILLAQKAFSAYAEYPLIGKYISGTTASGIYEARLGAECMGKENHVFAPAFTDEDMDGLKNDDLEQIVPIFAFSSKSYVSDICRLALANIERFVTSDFYIDRIKHISQLEYRCLAGQKLEGDLDIIVGFASVGEQTAIVDIANGFSHSNISNLGIEVYDAIGEFTNCISGLFATAISKKGSMLEITPQFAYENQFAKGDAYVLPIHIHDSEVLLFISASDETKAGDMPVVRKIMAKAGGEVTLDSKGTVVIVDDSGMSRKILRDILEEAGYAVLAEATDGLEGVLAYKTYYPDIITLDITMPNMDGTEALKEIKAYDSNAKVIMITAAGQQHKVIEALKLGAKRFITKPFDKEEILKNIEEVLEG